MFNAKKIILIVGDFFVLYLSLFAVLLIRYGKELTFERWQQHFWPFTIIYLIWIIVFFINGLYAITFARNNIKFYSLLLQTLIINAGLSITFFYFIPYFGIAPKTNLFLNLIIFAALFSIWRQFYNYSLRSTALVNNILIIGENKEINQIKDLIRNNPQLGYQIVQQIRPSDVQTPFDLLEIAAQKNVKTIVTAIDPRQNSKLVRSLYQCLPLKISFSDLPSFYEKTLNKIPISSIGEVWFLENLTESQKNIYEATKRVIDILGAIVLGLISLLFYPLVALVIKIDSAGSVFYKQRRIGLDGQIFNVIKFRSMIQEAEKGGVRWANQQDHRITRVGRFLRKARIDELPQLWNILLGQMAFIGPRPERIEFVQQLEKKIPYYQIRHIVKPGLSGWAQVNFHYGASVADSIEKLQYELYYIKHRSFILDLSITLKTISIVLRGMGR